MERFWSKVDIRGPDECWEWQGCRTEEGYGRFKLGNKVVRAHRVAYELVYGPIPDEIFALHQCDNPPCVNPQHVFTGTQVDNQQDCLAKGRRPAAKQVVKKGRSKLTEDDVRSIRARVVGGKSYRKVAADFGITSVAVCYIVNRRNWAHVV